MNRRSFIEQAGLTGVALKRMAGNRIAAEGENDETAHSKDPKTLPADVVIAGGGLGGCAAALAALRNNLRVILTEETDWIGGQLTQQGVPPDEHPWIETHGATRLYRELRERIRDYYRRNYPLTKEARERKNLNPGDGAVSRLCHEPRVALAVLQEMLAPYASSGRLTLLLETKIMAAKVADNRVKSLTAVNRRSGKAVSLSAPYFVDATELGDLLPITGTEYVTGSESRADTDELHAADNADPANNQAFTMVFAMDHVPGENHVIEKPDEYDYWRSYVPKMDPPWSGRLLDLMYCSPQTLKPKALGFHPDGVPTGSALNLWNYRRIINKNNFLPGAYNSDVTIVNWPQNDYFEGNLVDASEKDFQRHVARARQLSLSLLYWLQTEAPRADGGKGWPGLRLRKDILGTEDGLAKYPYVRESRRIKAVFTITEEHVGAEQRKTMGESGAVAASQTSAGGPATDVAADFDDSVGVGYYHIDLHPTCRGSNYVDFASLRFQIPLGALLPVTMENLLPANKNIGTTHITNGCYRLHPVEWSIGEAVGMLVKYAVDNKVVPRAVREEKKHLAQFQDFVRSQGIDTHWPAG